MAEEISGKIWEEKMEKAYQREENGIVLYTGLVDRRQYKDCCKGMYPVFAEDLEEKRPDTEAILAASEQKEPWRAGAFFLEADAETVNRLAQRTRPFYGRIRTKNLSYRAVIEVRQDKKYRGMVRQLFHIFLQNELPWRTLCVPYFHKMFEYFIVETDLPWYEQAEALEVDFEEYKKAVRTSFIPVWNLEPVQVVADQRPQWDASLGQYRHVINRRRLTPDCRYLASETELGIAGCRRRRGMEILCPVQKARTWRMYCVNPKVQLKNDYEIFGNETDLLRVCPAETKGGVFRLVSSLGYEERFVLTDVKVEGKQSGPPRDVFYSMNERWDENFPEKTGGPILKLEFWSRKRDYLQTDILSYLMSEVQRQYPNYCCAAKLARQLE